MLYVPLTWCGPAGNQTDWAYNMDVPMAQTTVEMILLIYNGWLITIKFEGELQQREKGRKIKKKVKSKN
jgi:hypothetical protein